MASGRNKKTIAIVVTVFVLLAVAGGFIFVNKVFAVKQINIEGSDKYTYDELYEYIFKDRNDKNTLLFKYTDKKAPKPEIPFIAKTVMDVRWPDTINITVYEKSIVGYVTYKGTNMYFDKDGMIVECSTEEFADVPRVCGLDFDRIVMYEKLDVPDDSVFGMINDFRQYLEKYSIPVDMINILENNEFSVKIDNVNVLLGAYDNTMPDKLYELKCMMSEFDGLKGTLHMENYDGSTKNIIFKNEQK